MPINDKNKCLLVQIIERSNDLKKAAVEDLQDEIIYWAKDQEVKKLIDSLNPKHPIYTEYLEQEEKYILTISVDDEGITIKTKDATEAKDPTKELILPINLGPIYFTAKTDTSLNKEFYAGVQRVWDSGLDKDTLSGLLNVSINRRLRSWDGYLHQGNLRYGANEPNSQE